MKHIFRPLVLFLCFESALCSSSFADNFSLISQGKPVSIYMDKTENIVVKTATSLFMSDMSEYRAISLRKSVCRIMPR